jgi:opacity protein-like surface antigen
MNKTIVALALALSTVTAAATDLPSKTAPSAPESPFGALSSPNAWAGVNVGGAIKDGANMDAPWTIGAVAGYNVIKMGPLGFGVEGTYDYREGNVQTAMGNVIASYSLGSFTPYVLAGAGYQWDKLGNPGPRRNAINEQVWNAGVGLKYAFTKTLEFDARYRRIDNWDRARSDDRATFGVNYKF